MALDTGLREFRVADVKQATDPLHEDSYPRVVEYLLKDHALGPGKFVGNRQSFFEGPPLGFVESCSQYHGKLVGVSCNPLLGALHYAFADHRPLCLSPDIIWLTLTQGLANHINLNAERLRRQFVTHDGKLKLIARRDDFVKGSPENPWSEVFASFSTQIKEHIGEAHGLIVADYSTTGQVERAASEVVLLDAMQSYFEYFVFTRCGIPQIVLEGSVDDWILLKNKVQDWSRFDLGWWVTELQPILDQFVAAAKGRIDRDFWDSIYKWNGARGSGTAPHVSGWILKMFPYLNTESSDSFISENTGSLCFNEWMVHTPSRRGGPGMSRFPHLPAKAPFQWEYMSSTFEMEFVGGLVGIRQDPDSLALRPEIGWAILDKTKLDQARTRNEEMLEGMRRRQRGLDDA